MKGGGVGFGGFEAGGLVLPLNISQVGTVYLPLHSPLPDFLVFDSFGQKQKQRLANRARCNCRLVLKWETHLLNNIRLQR